MKRCYLDNHVINNCLETEIQCEVCYVDQIKRKDMESHLDNFCPEKITEIIHVYENSNFKW